MSDSVLKLFGSRTPSLERTVALSGSSTRVRHWKAQDSELPSSPDTCERRLQGEDHV
jgi:hypothetical protein